MVFDKNWPIVHLFLGKLGQDKQTQPLWKNANFWTFLTPRFNSLERVYFYLEYRQTFFSSLLFLKEKDGKILIVGPNLCTNPLKIILTFLLYSYVVVDSS